MARYYRRNPEVLGLDVTRGVAVASGVYLAKNVGALLTSFLPGVASMVDGIRPGLSTGAMETLGAVAIAGFVAPMLPISGQHKGDLILGSTAIATSDVIASLVGQVNLLQGMPNFSGRVSGMVGGGSSKMSAKSAPAALPAPSGGFANSATQGSGQIAQQSMSTAQLLGVGTMGF